MKKIKFKNLEITLDKKEAKLVGEIDSQRNSTFEELEIREMFAAILQSLTNTGDGYGNPEAKDVQINGNFISGQKSGI